MYYIDFYMIQVLMAVQQGEIDNQVLQTKDSGVSVFWKVMGALKMVDHPA